ncbi:MAG: hypothetical protein H6745_13170 [Deltaproteobacteria bacterium]|nr:hypothetical protein [Deltaproteobacteria bacterium]
MKQLCLGLASVLWVIVGACGDDQRGIGGGDTAVTDTAQTDVADTAGGDTGGTAMLPNACSESVACSGSKACRSGVCVDDPPSAATATLTDPVDNTPTTDAPNLDCVDASLAAPVQTTTARLYGAVARFGDGRKTTDMHVDVILASDFDPSACESETGDEQITCYRAAGTVVGSATSTAPPTPDSLPASCSGHEDCPLGYQCVETSSVVHECKEQFGLFEVADVPLDTPLILRAYPEGAITTRWHDTYVYNVVLGSDEVVDGAVQYDATIVSDGQWLLTPNTVSLPEIPADHGAIGGRVRDCHTATRVSWPIAEVSIDTARPSRKVVYFNNLEDDTVPLVDRATTNIIGRFAALDIAPGWNVIAGSARVGGAVVTVGAEEVYVVPNALAIVSWPGKRPYWRQH